MQLVSPEAEQKFNMPVPLGVAGNPVAFSSMIA
jgi:hypothetical protein